jgi:hypothetical protein
VGWLAAVLFLLSPFAAPVQAATWEGKEVDKDGVPHMMNPATPIEEPTALQLTQRWEVGGDDDDELFFGVLTQITSDDKGNIYVLDAQLSEVFVFTPAGEYIRSIGREGEGPGEFRRPSDLFITPSGNVAVMQRMPGKIVLLTPDGDPIGNHALPETDGMRMFSGGRRAGDDVVLSAQQMRRTDGGFEIKSSLIRVNTDGEQLATYAERTDTRDMANMEMDEKTFGRGALVWSTDPNGRVNTSEDFDTYHIDVWAADGTLERVIERDYESRVRTDEEKKRSMPRVRIRRRGGRAQQMNIKMSDTDRDIQQLYPRGDGSLWVLASRGAFDADDKTIATFDVFDSEGRFINQITLRGDGDFVDDGFHFVGDRLFVVKGLRTAFDAMVGGADEDAEPVADPEPMSVICYGLDMFVQGE